MLEISMEYKLFDYATAKVGTHEVLQPNIKRKVGNQEFLQPVMLPIGKETVSSFTPKIVRYVQSGFAKFLVIIWIVHSKYFEH
ncbi:hypothetical protein HanHA300_Chr12g0432291 [Helianthus annuus]|nr:hypothetical protein HanHA300_Chr12g0432291 [Helianthus annuus]KAJ0504222.1 hypothetical protein HanHA89_Chr12g0456931 [Helianthus annuus]KAJ0673927.1 hypothetical protein HanLR1_Chr12g0434381 [Helianthus annuus]